MTKMEIRTEKLLKKIMGDSDFQVFKLAENLFNMNRELNEKFGGLSPDNVISIISRALAIYIDDYVYYSEREDFSERLFGAIIGQLHKEEE